MANTENLAIIFVEAVGGAANYLDCRERKDIVLMCGLSVVSRQVSVPSSSISQHPLSVALSIMAVQGDDGSIQNAAMPHIILPSY
jgi:hypothetical protein